MRVGLLQDERSFFKDEKDWADCLESTKRNIHYLVRQSSPLDRSSKLKSTTTVFMRAEVSSTYTAEKEERSESRSDREVRTEREVRPGREENSIRVIRERDPREQVGAQKRKQHKPSHFPYY